MTSTKEPVVPEEADTVTSLSSDKKKSSFHSTGSKAFPVCNDPEMMEIAYTTEKLNSLCFSDFSFIESICEAPPAVSSASYSSHSSSFLSDIEGEDLIKKFDALNKSVVKRTTSRTGRSGQRWMANPPPNQVVRLSTGCVPILADGRIMMVSSGKKSQWILPKGGWEVDEILEEAALRETFEEAGVVGILGPRLSEIHYETRKARERRLSSEVTIRHTKADCEVQFSSGWSDVSQLSEDDHLLALDPESIKPMPVPEAQTDVSTHEHKSKSNVKVSFQETPHQLSDKSAMQLVSGEVEKPQGSAESSSQVYTHVRLQMFPLYIKEARPSWPECGRLRTAFTIDEAIKASKSRPEIQSVLMEVKDRGIHMV